MIERYRKIYQILDVGEHRSMLRLSVMSVALGLLDNRMLLGTLCA